jgi:hypothetical protein
VKAFRQKILGNSCQSNDIILSPQKEGEKLQELGVLCGWVRANKNSQSTTALNHCVDCIRLKQSRRLTKSQLEGGGSQISIVA